MKTNPQAQQGTAGKLFWAILCVCGFLLALAGGAYLLRRQWPAPIPFTPTANPVLTSTSAPAPVSTFTPFPAEPSPPATIPAPAPTATPTLPPGEFTRLNLLSAEQPNRDLDDLARRFHPERIVSSPASTPSPRHFSLGDTDTFWVFDTNVEPPIKFQITARLAHLTDHAYWWVEEGFTVQEADIAASAQKFETQTYPVNHSLFGTEAIPGIDGDPRLHILMGRIPGVAGYFSASNQYRREVVDYSNQREMFLLDLNSLAPGTNSFDGVLAHEFQHMIHWQADANEEGWVNEGLSELAEFANGYGLSVFARPYLDQPDTQLTTWGRDLETQRLNYGASFLFILYLYDQLGEQAVRDLVAQPANGIAGIEQILQQYGANRTFDQFFADFVVAKYLNDPALANGRWGYVSPGAEFPSARLEKTHQQFPVTETAIVNQYGADYLEIIGSGPLTLTFSGIVTNALLNNQAHSGSYQWYSNRGDSSDFTLTRPFDLRGLTGGATLNFWAWYDLETDWDYAYVAVSTDQGQTWQALPATDTVDTNPVGNAYGPGFTGVSGQPAQWLEQTVDLSAYAGQEILLRFECVMDDAVNLPGFAIDDIAIPELGYFDGAESGEGSWTTRGFLRTDNVLPQRFTVTVIEFDAAGQPSVAAMSLDEQNTGRYRLGLPANRAVVAISAHAPVTTNPAQYHYTLVAAEQ